MYELHFANNCTNYGSLGCPLIHKKVTLEEILALRHVWITLRQQLHELWQLRLSPYIQKNHDEENLSVATYMNYTRLFQQLPDNSPLTGAQTFVQLLAKCNPYTPQR